MSYPKAKPRQSGNTQYAPGNCGICNLDDGMPTGNVAIVIKHTGSCCSPDLDNATGWILTPQASPCGRDANGNPNHCAWAYTFIAAGFYITLLFAVGCVDGVPTFSLSITAIDTSNNTQEVLADGSYTSTDACGNVNCNTLLNSGDTPLTLYGTNVCNPGFCTNPTWAVSATTAPCGPQANSCCCGGQPAKPCIDCCGDGGKTRWDVDLTAWPYPSYTGGDCCDVIKDVFTLDNSGAAPCIWKYSVPLNCPNVSLFPIELSCSAGGTNWILIVGGTFSDSFGAEYHGTATNGCADSITLSFYQWRGSNLDCYINPPYPAAVTISPA